jgi:hypothetical protein
MVSGMDQGIKVRENRLRRMAGRQGLRLLRNPRRDPHATDYGSYKLTDVNAVLVADFGWEHPALPESGSWLNEVEAYLTGPHKE